MAQAKRLPLAASGVFVVAAIVGGLGGLAGWAFRWALDLIQQYLMGQGGSVVDAARDLSPWARLVVPAIGGFVAGLLIWALGRRYTPFGISDLMDMVGNRRSHIAPLRSLVQVLSSACSLASGGSLGREGAITQLGTTIASTLTHLFKEKSRNRIVVLACGTAAGMASSYNAPLAGAIFVMEVILGSFAMEIFAPLVVAAVSSAVVTHYLAPDATALYVSQSESVLNTHGIVFSALLLGLLCGVGGVLFNSAMGWGKWLFRRVPGPPVVPLTLGGLLVGAIGIWYPEVWGNGQEAIELTREEYLLDRAFLTLGAIVVLKVVATAFTTGSGALGGVFTPTLVVGAACGAFFSVGLEHVLLLEVEHKQALVLVGMAGICAATTHAPITAIFLIFELTRDYHIILPVMLCSISASLVARTLRGDSYYTARLRSKSSAQATGLEELALQGNYVRDVMRGDAVRVHSNSTFDEVMQQFSGTRRDSIYVVDDAATLLGRIHLHDIKFFLNDPSLASVVIAADLTRKAVSATPRETLAGIIGRFDDPDLDELAVVQPGDTPVLLGRITRRDLMACLSDEVLNQRKLRTRFRRKGDTEDIHVELPVDAELSKLKIPANLVSRTVGSLDLPDGVLPIIVVQRTAEGLEERLIADPGVVLASGAELIVVGKREDLAGLDEILANGAA
jgi:CIC family chloride channel protein